MGPEIIVDRNASPPIVNFSSKKNQQKQTKNTTRKSSKNNTDYSSLLELVFHEVIGERRHRLISAKNFLRLLPFLKVEEILVLPWSIVCEKYLKKSGQRLSELSSHELNELLNKVPWPLTGEEKDNSERSNWK